jgi:hypothetical protein
VTAARAFEQASELGALPPASDEHEPMLRRVVARTCPKGPGIHLIRPASGLRSVALVRFVPSTKEESWPVS